MYGPLPYQATFICIQIIMSLVYAMLWVSNASAIVKIALILNFNFVSSLKEQHVMTFVYSLMTLPLCGNIWEYYQV